LSGRLSCDGLSDSERLHLFSEQREEALISVFSGQIT
jgi:hypothetical protein